jgi:hypothetical protein
MQIRKLTKQAMGVVAAASALLQIPDVTNLLKSAVLNHPHLSSLLGGLLLIAALLHNPAVIQALGLKVTQTETTAEVVPLVPLQP